MNARPRKLGLIHRNHRNRVRHIGTGGRHWPLPLCGSIGDHGRWSYRTGKDVHDLPLCGWCRREYQAIKAAMEAAGEA